MTEISPARPSDLPDIHTMIRALSAFHGDTATATLQDLQDLFFGSAPKAAAFIARLEGEAVGYAGVTWDIVLHEASVRMDIHHLYVCERHRSQGVGTSLIKAARAYAVACKDTRLTIGTDPRNAQAIAAYRAMPALQEMLDPGPRFRIDLLRAPKSQRDFDQNS